MHVGEDHVSCATPQQKTGDRRPGRPRAADHDLRVFQPAPQQPHGVQDPGQHHHRRPVLVVVEDRDVQHGPQAPLDLEAPRRRDVLQVDPPERRRQVLDRRDDLIRVLRPQADRKRLDARVEMEQHRFPFHHRQGRARSQIAQAQHRRPVRHDRNEVALGRVVIHFQRILGDLFGRLRGTRRHVERA